MITHSLIVHARTHIFWHCSDNTKFNNKMVALFRVSLNDVHNRAQRTKQKKKIFFYILIFYLIFFLFVVAVAIAAAAAAVCVIHFNVLFVFHLDLENTQEYERKVKHADTY